MLVCPWDILNYAQKSLFIGETGNFLLPPRWSCDSANHRAGSQLKGSKGLLLGEIRTFI